MDRQAKPLKLELYEGEGNFWAGLLHGVLTIGLGLVIIVMFAAPHDDGFSAMPLGLVFCAVGIGMIVFATRRVNNPRPYFKADRNGFRIRSGRLRPWGEFYGARVVERRSEGSKVGEAIQIKVRPDGLFAYRTAAVLKFSDRGQLTVDRIIVLKHNLEDLWAEEAKRFDLGGSPVVTARERAARRPAAPVSLGERARDFVGRLLGRRQQR